VPGSQPAICCGQPAILIDCYEQPIDVEVWDEVWAVRSAIRVPGVQSPMHLLRRIPRIRLILLIVLACSLNGIVRLPKRAQSTPLVHSKGSESPKGKESSVQQSRGVSHDAEPSGEVGWDPVSIWDGPNPAEPAGMFIAGTLVASVVSVFALRRRTRRASSRLPHAVITLHL